VAIAVGTAAGLFNGLVVAVLGIDSLLVTLATQFIVTSIATSVAGYAPPYGFAGSFLRLGQGTVADVPVALLIFLLLALATIGVVNYTTLGRSMVLIGYSRRAADYTGITSRRALCAVFTLSGALAGVGGLLRLGAAGERRHSSAASHHRGGPGRSRHLRRPRPDRGGGHRRFAAGIPEPGNVDRGPEFAGRNDGHGPGAHRCPGAQGLVRAELPRVVGREDAPAPGPAVAPGAAWLAPRAGRAAPVEIPIGRAHPMERKYLCHE